MKYVAYYRVSTAKQGQSGLGLQAQQLAVKAFAAGHAIIGEYTEIESGKRDDRPQLEEALEYAAEQKATLVLAKLDRLSRDVHFISGLLKRNVPIKACDMPNADNFQFHIMAAVAEKEREMISERTKAAIAAKRERGEPWGANTKRSELADFHAMALKPAIEGLIAEGCVRPSEMARRLNSAGYRTQTGKQFENAQVVRVMRRLGMV